VWHVSDNIDGGFWGANDVSEFWTASDLPQNTIQAHFVGLGALAVSDNLVNTGALSVSSFKTDFSPLSISSDSIFLGGFFINVAFIGLTPLSITDHHIGITSAPIGSFSCFLTPLPVSSELIGLCDIGYNLANLSYVLFLSSMAAGTQAVMPVPLPIQRNVFGLSEMISAKQSQLIGLGGIASGPVTGQHIGLTDLAPDAEASQGMLIGLSDIGNPAPIIRSHTWDILLDGISIKARINTLSIRLDESSVHNYIEFTSLLADFYKDCDSALRRGESRIEVTIDGRTRYFMVDDREINEPEFTITGMSLSGNLDTPYHTGAYIPEEPKAASEIASEMLQSRCIWNVADWVVPAEFESQAPFDGVQRLAEAVGAVARSKI